MTRNRRSTNYGDRQDLFTRYKKLDVTQLGTIWHGYIYKNILPLQASTGKNFTYDMIRTDYILDEVPDDLYEDERIFFRTPLKDFTLDQMIEACERVYQKVKDKVDFDVFDISMVHQDKKCTPLDRAKSIKLNSLEGFKFD